VEPPGTGALVGWAVAGAGGAPVVAPGAGWGGWPVPAGGVCGPLLLDPGAGAVGEVPVAASEVTPDDCASTSVTTLPSCRRTTPSAEIATTVAVPMRSPARTMYVSASRSTIATLNAPPTMPATIRPAPGGALPDAGAPGPPPALAEGRGETAPGGGDTGAAGSPALDATKGVNGSVRPVLDD